MGSLEWSLERRTIGNASLDRYLAEQPQPFLRRNLRFIFDRHESRLKDIKAVGSTMNGAEELRASEPLVPPVETCKQLAAWNHSAGKKLRQYISTVQSIISPQPGQVNGNGDNIVSSNVDGQFHNSTAILYIQKLVIRIPSMNLSQSQVQDNTRLSTFIDDDLESLGDADDQLTHPLTTCTISVFIDRKERLGRVSPKSISRTGTMQLVNGRFELSLRDPCQILQPDGEDWLIFSVTIRNKDPRFASFMLPRSQAAKLSGIGLKKGVDGEYSMLTDVLQMRWNCKGKRSSQILHNCSLFSHDSTHQRLQIQPVLSIELGWRIRPQRTALAAFSEASRRLPTDRPQQLPTPSSSGDLDHNLLGVRITYTNSETRRLIQSDLTCPLCQKDLGFTTFDRLHLHLRVHHDHFDFVVHDDDEDDTSLGVHKIVAISIGEAPLRKSNNSDNDEKNFDWIAPSRPFDKDVYLAGESTWDNRPPASRNSRLSRQKGRLGTNGKAMKIEPLPSIPPHQVPDLPSRTPILHSVPHVLDDQGSPIQFYRTGSKQPLKAGELVAESDEELDDAWLVERQRQHFRRLKVKGRSSHLPAADQKFMVDFNIHVNREGRRGINGDRLMRDSVIRFARLHQPKLQTSGWQSQFRAKLVRLIKYGMCDQNDLIYCLDAVQTAAKGGNGHVDRRIVEDSTMSDKHKSTTNIQRHLCTCGKRVDDIRAAVYCAHHNCPRDAFHMRCVDLKSRPQNWLCSECPTVTANQIQT